MADSSRRSAQTNTSDCLGPRSLSNNDGIITTTNRPLSSSGDRFIPSVVIEGDPISGGEKMSNRTVTSQRHDNKERYTSYSTTVSRHTKIVYVSVVAIIALLLSSTIQETKFLSSYYNQNKRLIDQQQQEETQATAIEFDKRNLTKGPSLKGRMNDVTMTFMEPKNNTRHHKDTTTNEARTNSSNGHDMKVVENSASSFDNLSLAGNRTIMYIHVGKTGGYTTDAVLKSNCEWYKLHKPRQICFDNLQNSTESMLSKLTKSTTHISPRPNYRYWIGNTTTFLFSLRNPISRAVSAYDMDHILNIPHGKQKVREMRTSFYTCFPDAEHLAQALREDKEKEDPLFIGSTHSNNVTSNTTNTSCTSEFAYNVLTGKDHLFYNTHLYHNHQKYASFTTSKYPEKEIMLIRTEYLWGDISKLDKLLGGTGKFDQAGHQFDHGSQTYQVKSKLSPEGKRLFCRALKDEIEIYKDLIQKAVNLNDFEKQESLAKLQQDCGQLGQQQ